MAQSKQAASKAQEQDTVQNEAQKILEEAKAEAAKIVAEARAQTEAAPQREDSEEELVPIRLFKDGDKYKDDVFVAVNGRAFQIKRGVTVNVPKYVADVLDQSMEQDNATASLIERESSGYEAEARARNIL